MRQFTVHAFDVWVQNRSNVAQQPELWSDSNHSIKPSDNLRLQLVWQPLNHTMYISNLVLSAYYIGYMFSVCSGSVVVATLDCPWTWRFLVRVPSGCQYSMQLAWQPLNHTMYISNLVLSAYYIGYMFNVCSGSVVVATLDCPWTWRFLVRVPSGCQYSMQLAWQPLNHTMYISNLVLSAYYIGYVFREQPGH